MEHFSRTSACLCGKSSGALSAADPQTLDEAADWLHAAAYNLRFAYKLKGKITVDIKVEQPAGQN
jgi:hypothetical protein